MIDLSAKHRDMVLDILRQRIPQARVYVFGSRAKGTSIKSSDLDLAITSDTPFDKFALAELKVDFSDSDLPFFVDVVELDKVSDEFREMINDSLAVLCEPA